MHILVTGGAGFVGSHLIDFLLADGHSVVCIDDLSLGKPENIAHFEDSDGFEFRKLDILNKDDFGDIFKKNRFDCVFHMAANSDIQLGGQFLNVDFERTFLTTYTVLESMKEHGIKDIVFASTSAIYGELSGKLSEVSGPLCPVSFYGAAKLASEGYISAACTNFSMRAWVVRFPNVIGERTTHGVIYDFINKLQNNPKELIILGNGQQEKPYLYVKDLVQTILFVWKNMKENFNCCNVSVDSASKVTRIAEIVVEEMGLKDVKFNYTGGDRGWVGDVPKFEYDISKLKALGWKSLRSSDDAVRLAVREELKLRGIGR